MELSVEEIKGYLRELGIGPHITRDGRVYFLTPIFHGCGEETGWLMKTDAKEESVSNLGAYCGGCKTKLNIPTSHLKDLVRQKRIDGVIKSVEEQAAFIEQCLKKNQAWFDEMMAAF